MTSVTGYHQTHGAAGSPQAGATNTHTLKNKKIRLQTFSKQHHPALPNSLSPDLYSLHPSCNSSHPDLLNPTSIESPDASSPRSLLSISLLPIPSTIHLAQTFTASHLSYPTSFLSALSASASSFQPILHSTYRLIVLKDGSDHNIYQLNIFTVFLLFYKVQTSQPCL